MCTEPPFLLLGHNPIWKAISNSGHNEPWCLVYQLWWWNIVALVLVALPVMIWSWKSVAFFLGAWHQVHEKHNWSVMSAIFYEVKPLQVEKFFALSSALVLIMLVSFVGITIANYPDLLIWGLGIDESKRVYDLSRDGIDYLLSALRQIAFAMLSAWLAALFIGFVTMPPLISNFIATLANWVRAAADDFLSGEESNPTTTLESTQESGDGAKNPEMVSPVAGKTTNDAPLQGSIVETEKLTQKPPEKDPLPKSPNGDLAPQTSPAEAIPDTYWKAYQSRKNFEPPKITLHARIPLEDEAIEGMGEKMAPKKLSARVFWLSQDGLHLWLRQPPKATESEAFEKREFKLFWQPAKQCFMAQANKLPDEKIYKLDTNANYCELPIPRFTLELELVLYTVHVDI